MAAGDPSEPFVEAARERHPGVDIRLASAESLPWADGSFDVALAQLVVHFMTDPVAGLREMARVTRPGGTVAACVWDFGSGRAPLSLFWRAVLELDPGAHDESDLAGARGGDLAPAVLGRPGLVDINEAELQVTRSFDGFDDWWEPYTHGVGPAGSYVVGLDEVGKGGAARAMPIDAAGRALHDDGRRLGRPGTRIAEPRVLDGISGDLRPNPGLDMHDVGSGHE